MMQDRTEAFRSQTWHDITEPFDALLLEWYGDLTDRFDPADEDLADMVMALNQGNPYWKNPPTMTSFQKIRRKYEWLLDAYALLQDELSALRLQLQTNPSLSRVGVEIFSSDASHGAGGEKIRPDLDSQSK